MKQTAGAIIFGTVVYFAAIKILAFVGHIFPVIRDPYNFSVVVFSIVVGLVLGFISRRQGESKIRFAVVASVAAVVQQLLATLIFSPKDLGFIDVYINSNYSYCL